VALRGLNPFSATSSPSSSWCSYRTLVDLDQRLQRLEHEAPSTLASTANPIGSASEASHRNRSISNESLNKPPSWASIYRGDASAGQASNYAFAQQVASAVNPNDDHIRSHQHTIGVTSTALGFPISTSSVSDIGFKDLVLPPRLLADKIMSCYWDLIHPIFPLLHKPTMETKYAQLWVSGNTAPDIVTYGLVNMVLAVGCQRNEELNTLEREELAHEFYKRSVRLVSLDSFDAASMEVLQVLLLRGIYLLYTPYATRCWTTVSMVMRLAEYLGLHVENDTACQLGREMRRRVWYCCTIIDWYWIRTFPFVSWLHHQGWHGSRIVAVSFDQQASPLKDKARVSLPGAIDDEFLSATSLEGEQPPGQPSRLEFFALAIRQLAIREKFDTFEIQNSKGGKIAYSGQALGDTLDLMCEIDRFGEELPPHLRTDGTRVPDPRPDAENCFKMQASILRTRCVCSWRMKIFPVTLPGSHALFVRSLYARLRILRPLVVAEATRCVCASRRGQNARASLSGIQSKLCRELCELCVSCAHEALDDLHSQLTCSYPASPWHCLYCQSHVFCSAGLRSRALIDFQSLSAQLQSCWLPPCVLS